MEDEVKFDDVVNAIAESLGVDEGAKPSESVVISSVTVDSDVETEKPERKKVFCAICNAEHYEDELWEDENGNLVCSICKERWYRECSECGKWFDKRAGGRSYGPTMYGGKWYCGDCREDFCECSECGEVLRRDDATKIHNGNYVCDDCRDEHYHCCESCGSWYHEDDGYTCGDDEWRCNSCAESWEDDHRNMEGVMGYHDFDRGRYEAHRISRSDPDEKMLFGVELECDDGNFDSDDFLWWTSDMSNLIHFESDGSLSDEGVECITMPCSLKYHQEKMDWKCICETFTNQGFKSHNTDTCGLHVHMSRSQLTPIQIVKMDVFYNRGKDFWSQVGRRDKIYFGRWDKFKRCVKEKGTCTYGSHDDRYQVLNTTNGPTVELRFCRGTLNHETILGTLELFHAVPKFLDTIPIAHIYETEKNLMAFIEYVADNYKKYPHAFPMMRRLVKFGPWCDRIGMYYGKFTTSHQDNEH